MDDAFYLPLGDGRFEATPHTGGPWDPELQHGGPPSGLLVRALEGLAGLDGVLTRVSIDLLGPVPVTGLEVTAHVSRPGRSVELVVAELSAGGRVAARATAWRIRVDALALPPGPAATHGAPPPLPDIDSPSPAWPGGFLEAMSWRVVAGDWSAPGPATVWGRMRMPLVLGEEPSGLQRLMLLADCGNGVSATLPHERWMFINPELSVHLVAQPSGEWLCIEARTTLDAAGFGLASSQLFDHCGLVGLGAQSLFVAGR